MKAELKRYAEARHASRTFVLNDRVRRLRADSLVVTQQGNRSFEYHHPGRLRRRRADAESLREAREHQVTVWHDCVRTSTRSRSGCRKRRRWCFCASAADPQGGWIAAAAGVENDYAEWTVSPHRRGRVHAIAVSRCARSMRARLTRPRSSTWGLIIARCVPDPAEMATPRAGNGSRRRSRDCAAARWACSAAAGSGGRSPATAGRSACRCWCGDAKRVAQRRGPTGTRSPREREALFEEVRRASMHVHLGWSKRRGLVTAADLARMQGARCVRQHEPRRPGCAGALVAALRAGRPDGGSRRLRERTGIGACRHPLLAFDNVVCTPHLGYVERDQLENYFSDQFERVLAFAAGKPRGVVNPEAFR